MIKIAIIDDEKEMSSILSNYVNKYAKEKNIDPKLFMVYTTI